MIVPRSVLVSAGLHGPLQFPSEGNTKAVTKLSRQLLDKSDYRIS